MKYGEIHTLEAYPPEYGGEEAELREAIEAGRRHKIAAEVWSEFLDDRRFEILRLLEQNVCYSSEELQAFATELRVIRKFQDMSDKMIALGEIAEERMNEIGG